MWKYKYKNCVRCKLEKPHQFFSWDLRGQYMRRDRCKACVEGQDADRRIRELGSSPVSRSIMGEEVKS